MKQVIEIYTCDRCHNEMEEPHRDQTIGTAEFSYAIDYGTAGDANCWKEMCESCNAEMVSLIKSEIEVAKMMRRSKPETTPYEEGERGR